MAIISEVLWLPRRLVSRLPDEMSWNGRASSYVDAVEAKTLNDVGDRVRISLEDIDVLGCVLGVRCLRRARSEHGAEE